MIQGILSSVNVSFNLMQRGKLSCRECITNFDLDFADLRCDTSSSRKEFNGEAEEAFFDLNELLHVDSNAAPRKLSNSLVRVLNPDSTRYSS